MTKLSLLEAILLKKDHNQEVLQVTFETALQYNLLAENMVSLILEKDLYRLMATRASLLTNHIEEDHKGYTTPAK